VQANRLNVVLGDITQQHVDAIVNAANTRLKGGGGVDGAIHRAAGPELLKASLSVAPCPEGEARITPGFKLPARWVIHAVGPFWSVGRRNADALLASAYRNSLDLAAAHAVRTLAFPSISTGAYRFPLEQAAAIAVRTIRPLSPRGVVVRLSAFMPLQASRRRCEDANQPPPAPDRDPFSARPGADRATRALVRAPIACRMPTAALE
jgi:O-acetyl-ADP-ribose deacetylase